MINVFLCFSKYKVKHIVVINGSFWGNQGLDSIKIIFSTKPSGSVWAHFEPDSNFHNFYNLNCELIP